MGMNDRSWIDKINLIFIALTTTSIYNCQSAWKPGKFRVSPEFNPGGRAQRKCDTSTINHAFNNAFIDILHCLNADFCSSLPDVRAKKTDHIRSMICRRIHPTGTLPALAQPHVDQSTFDEDLLEYIPEGLIEQPDNFFNPLSHFVPATEVIMQFSAVLPMGGFAITSSSQPVSCSNSNSNSNNITSITNMTSIDSMGLVDGSTIVEGAMCLGG